MNEKIKSIIAKLRALSEDTNNLHEAENAARKIKQIMSAHGLTEADIESAEKQTYIVRKIKTEWEGRLLHQVLYMVTNDSKGWWRYIGQKNARIIECLPSEFLQVDYLFNFYRNAYYAELDIFNNAFIQKHRLFGKLKEEDIKKIDKEEWERQKKVLDMASKISDATPHVPLKNEPSLKMLERKK